MISLRNSQIKFQERIENHHKLPDLILVMLARKKSNEEMVEELDPFLESESEKFVTWMMKLYTKLVGMTPNANKPAYLPKTTEKKRIESTDDEKGNLTEKNVHKIYKAESVSLIRSDFLRFEKRD